MSATSIEIQADNRPARERRPIRRLGIAAFAFFFLKGMLWLLVPIAAVWRSGL